MSSTDIMAIILVTGGTIIGVVFAIAAASDDLVKIIREIKRKY